MHLAEVRMTRHSDEMAEKYEQQWLTLKRRQRHVAAFRVDKRQMRRHNISCGGKFINCR
jgi:hypothetical protein